MVNTGRAVWELNCEGCESFDADVLVREGFDGSEGRWDREINDGACCSHCGGGGGSGSDGDEKDCAGFWNEFD